MLRKLNNNFTLNRFNYLRTLFEKFISHPGQITIKSEIGRWIYCLSSLESIKSIVEIGTWNGNGSSKLIARGVKSRLGKESDCEVIGLEINLKQYFEAKKNLKRFKFFKVMHGRLVEESDLDLSDLSDDEKYWAQHDILDFRTCNNVEMLIPGSIDLLILDGGEFSTYAEYIKLYKKVHKYLILDDTRTRKCARILDEAIKTNTFVKVFDSTERNGTAVLIKTEFLVNSKLNRYK